MTKFVISHPENTRKTETENRLGPIHPSGAGSTLSFCGSHPWSPRVPGVRTHAHISPWGRPRERAVCGHGPGVAAVVDLALLGVRGVSDGEAETVMVNPAFRRRGDGMKREGLLQQAPGVWVSDDRELSECVNAKNCQSLTRQVVFLGPQSAGGDYPARLHVCTGCLAALGRGILALGIVVERRKSKDRRQP